MLGKARARLSIRATLVALLSLAAFAPVVTYGFAYDDAWTIEQNEFLDRSLRWLLKTLVAGEGAAAHIPDATRPVMVVSSWIDNRIFGHSPAGHHLVSLLLYAIASVLSFHAAFALSRRLSVALVSGVVFALAPLHAEVVAAVNYREDLFAAIGVLGPLAWLAWPGARVVRPIHQIAISALWGLGLFAKESAIAFPLLFAAAIVIKGEVRSAWRRHEAALVALGAVFLVWANWRAALLLGGDDVPRAKAASSAELLFATARFETRAVLEALVPLSSAPEYPRDAAASWVWVPIALAIIAAIVDLARRRRTRTAALGLSIVLLAALPASPLVGPVNPRADRYLFLSVLGSGLVWGWAVDRYLEQRRPKPLRLALTAVPLLLMLACFRAERCWRDDLSLWTTAVRTAPSSPRAWTGLSRALRLKGDVIGAGRAVDHALDLDDGFVPARVTRAYTLIALGDCEAAGQEIDHLEREGYGEFRGVPKAARCVRLPTERARKCISER